MVQAKKRLLARLAVLAVGVLLVSGLGCGVHWLNWWFSAVKAKAYVSLALGFANESTELTPSVYDKAGIPRALRSRESVVVYCLLRAADLDGGRWSGAYFWLGNYFLRRDCGLARYYLERHVKAVGSSSPEAVGLLLNEIKAGKCGDLSHGTGPAE